jgi:hypothetical protein
MESIGYISPDSRMTILDLATGQGANLAYLGKRYPLCKFIGVELNKDNVAVANQVLKERGVDNCRAVQDDWYSLGKIYHHAFDGVLSFQTLSWFPDFREPMLYVTHLNPKWICMSSLFYDGLVSATTETMTYDEEGRELRRLFYNVYSIPVVKLFLNNNGYTKFKSKKFEIDVDVPPDGTFRTYTERTFDGRRIQISGPVFMPWHFIAAERAES